MTLSLDYCIIEAYLGDIMATKFVYSDQDVQEITAKYQVGQSLEVLAVDYNKSVASVRMKLVKLGVYKAATAKVTGTAKKTSTSKSQDLADFRSALALVGEARW